MKSVTVESYEGVVKDEAATDNFEVFKKEEGAVDFRTVSWIHAAMIFTKMIFATGVLSIPSALYTLGAAPGAICIIGFVSLNSYCGFLLGEFRNIHPGCHSVADMAQLIGGKVLREIIGGIFLLSFVVSAATGVLGVSVALNALSNHAICTNYFLVVATIAIAAAASVRKFEKFAWLTWAGFFSIFIAIFIVVVGVTTLDRPAAAPQTGDFELGYHAIAHPTFAAGITAAATIFGTSAAPPAFLPVISEMKRPKDFNKALLVCMIFVVSSYLAFSLVVYRWCGQWVASPSLGSAGPVLKKVAFGVGLFGLLISAALYVHVAAKYIFVRILRNTDHLQRNTFVHWGVWMGCTLGLSIISFLIASGIPIFDYIVGLAGSLCFAPLATGFPAMLWLYDYGDYRKGTIIHKAQFGVHILMAAFALFLTIGGTYGVVQQIILAYETGKISSAFPCADNSNSS
ncbi:hypothetical protein P152DRAFT_387626 [Eremomyces bilateralis CBS 781.70]|uniref:Amino acid transporter transmembrane domain-containing protein n=1 Tax=Eremomyces bilateralis CBS 781.70 TaxID=1392243 RepID=A0A6G1GGZ1_9PEZI|nr:uncharacterized protein P152DRAFT_387626 [Eremomyces bilateralis CBS 781.70]KAF1817171.1 hypothetical protein P152DRAFT_387626 [Eremomyces bilateralis CBS 781.70]